MDKKPRLGSDPLEWIKDTRKEAPLPSKGEGKQSKHSLHKTGEKGGDMRKRNGVILAVIGYIIIFCYAESWGADWKFIGQDVVGSVLEIDVASISCQPNNIVRVLVKHTRSKKSVTDWVKQFGEEYKDFSYSIDLEEYHCTEKKRRILNLAQYSLGGGIIFSDNSPGEWSFIIPDSTADAVFEEVCKQSK